MESGHVERGQRKQESKKTNRAPCCDEVIFRFSETLMRIRSGNNKSYSVREFVVICYEVIKQAEASMLITPW